MIKFIHLPVHIWAMADLQPGQRVLLALVHGFTASGKGLRMSNNALGEVLGVSGRTVRRWLSILDDLGRVKIEDEGGHRVVYLSGGVDTAMTGGVDTAMSGGGGQSHDHHIERKKTKDIKYNYEEMNERPTPEQVTDYLMTTPAVTERGYTRGQVKRIATDAVQYYEANQWRTAKGQPVGGSWKGVMTAWIKRATQKHNPVQSRPQRDPDLLRGDIKWHTRRMMNYEDRGQFRQAAGEANAIKGIQDRLRQIGEDEG